MDFDIPILKGTRMLKQELMKYGSILLLTLGACGVPAGDDAAPTPSTEVSADAEMNEAATEPAKPQADNVAVNGRFDAFENNVFLSLELGAGVSDLPERLSYNQTTPPMPFMLQALNTYQIGNEYRLYSKDFDLDIKVGDAKTPTLFELVQYKDRFMIFVDGVEVYSGEGALISGETYRLFSNGTGRIWDAEILNLSFLTDFDENLAVDDLRAAELTTVDLSSK